ncbi:polyprenyl synthetase family protein [Corynebacterium guangdongense]|uniref:Heptaprenyl diphosphate synthase n=1 Tax=Corynebacterium guangdongense TaxID=1783348 RepID=A0ABU1ZU67_9CORY|nr:polyprenyl synthetase family protein [Corynebacterium guangdongense]MDR7328472.1 heptaprenyl diphosphate synthase [Corynebacterium guangdongense]WJZ17049.1 Heptaprenyl diphosphate synthase component 2 [Corynebacterium guangdongense]
MTTGPSPSPRNITSVDLGDADLNARISSGMADVEALLESTLTRGEPFIVEKVAHLAKAGGKRFRPMMALLASQYGTAPGCERVVKAAVIVEVVHLATLYHDDVMDEADKRRGVESANSRWGNSVAILAGDILLAHASRLMSQLDTRTVGHFADTFEELVTGQMRETVGESAGLSAVEHYMQVIREKTGVLIASAGYLGALHGGADEEIVDALYHLGGVIGVIFQIVDDMIDIFSATDDSGKTPGTDLREGVFTLPVLYALEEEGEVGDELRALLTGPLTDDAEVDRALELLRRSTGRACTMQVVQGLLDEAESYISRLPAGPATDALRALSKYTIHRVG